MFYAQMLDNIVAQSELSLRQIAKRCAELNVSVTPSYISQLKNGKLPPASEEVTLALAQVCGEKNVSKLIFQGYIEKAPTLMREYIFASAELSKSCLKVLYEKTNVLTDDMRSHINNLDIITALELSEEHTMDNSLSILSLSDKLSAATGGFIKEDFASGEMTKFFLTDTSMSPAIPVNSFVYLLPTKRDLLKNRDIIAFYPQNTKSLTLRRFFNEKSKCLLIPEDKSQQLFIYDDLSEINYMGKAISYKADL